MHRTLWLAALAALALSGCGDKGDDDTGDGAGEGGGSGGGDLPSVWDDHDEDHCEGGEYDDVPGATSYFLGEFTKDDDTWGGTEYWVLYANDVWAEADNGQDCQIAWTVQLTETDPSACSVCEYGLEGGATIDLSKTTCSQEGLWSGEENVQLSYDVNDDGVTATFYFSGSGTYLGEGHSNGDGALNYLSDPQCDYF